MISKQILIVDDMLTDAEALTHKLKRLGHREISHVYNSASALSLLREKTFDVILIDFELKDSSLDGVGLAKIISKNISTPLIFVTGYHDNDITDKIMRSGACDHLVKPASISQLKVALNRAFMTSLLANERTFELQRISEKTKFFRLRDRKTVQALQYSSIQFIVWAGKIGRIYVSDEIQFEINMSSNNALEEYLHEDLFLRLNKGTLANLLNIDFIRNNQVHFKGIKKLKPISIGKKYYGDLIEATKKLDLNFKTIQS